MTQFTAYSTDLTAQEHDQYIGVLAYVRRLLAERPCRCHRFGDLYVGKHLALSQIDIRHLYELMYQGELRANKRIFKLALREVQYGRQMYVPIGHNN